MKTTIARKRRAGRGGAADAETSFESLRAQGVRLTQALSGHTWTDYNLHDPGVTILEQLCYALTDLVYRADFPVADHLLAPGEEEIDYAGLSLHPPAEAFPSRATSASDCSTRCPGSTTPFSPPPTARSTACRSQATRASTN